MSDKFVELWQSSTIVQGTMALACVGAIIYLAVAGKQIPEVLTGVVMAIIGFYFGSKSQQRA